MLLENEKPVKSDFIQIQWIHVTQAELSLS